MFIKSWTSLYPALNLLQFHCIMLLSEHTLIQSSPFLLHCFFFALLNYFLPFFNIIYFFLCLFFHIFSLGDNFSFFSIGLFVFPMRKLPTSGYECRSLYSQFCFFFYCTSQSDLCTSVFLPSVCIYI